MTAPFYGRQAQAADLVRLIRQVGPCARALEAARGVLLAGTDVGRPVLRLMEALDAAGPRSVPKIAAALGVTRQAIQPLVDRLVAKGEAEGLPNAQNHRSPLIRLTGQGRAVLAKVQACEREIDARIARRFPLVEVAAARRTLEGLTCAYAAIDAETATWAYAQADPGP